MEWIGFYFYQSVGLCVLSIFILVFSVRPLINWLRKTPKD